MGPCQQHTPTVRIRASTDFERTSTHPCFCTKVNRTNHKPGLQWCPSRGNRTSASGSQCACKLHRANILAHEPEPRWIAMRLNERLKCPTKRSAWLEPPWRRGLPWTLRKSAANDPPLGLRFAASLEMNGQRPRADEERRSESLK